MNAGRLLTRSGRLGLDARLRCHARAFAAEKEQLLDTQQINSQLRAQETTIPIHHEAISYVDVNRLGANDPCEDQHAAAKCSPAGSYLFGIFDGHGGGQCAEAASRRLFDYCCSSLSTRHVPDYSTFHPRQLQWLAASANRLDSARHRENVAAFLSAFRAAQANSGRSTVRRALQRAFTALDEDLSRDALSADGEELEAALRLVVTGSCACVAHVRGPHLHIANVGDSVAVLAVRQETEVGGSWTARQLTQEHIVENSLEVSRIRGNHPHSEASSVLRGGRLLGELMPLRAFGDVRYKWETDVQESLFGPGVAPAASKTPPYLTALPEVYYHHLTPNDRFLVIASDGLWECLTPDRVVRLLADHGAGKETLQPFEPGPEALLGDALQTLRKRKKGEGKRPLDVNGATHLIRTALGGSKAADQPALLSEALSLPLGIARNYRDDITVQVPLLPLSAGDKEGTGRRGHGPVWVRGARGRRGRGAGGWRGRGGGKGWKGGGREESRQEGGRFLSSLTSSHLLHSRRERFRSHHSSGEEEDGVGPAGAGGGSSHPRPGLGFASPQ